MLLPKLTLKLIFENIDKRSGIDFCATESFYAENEKGFKFGLCLFTLLCFGGFGGLILESSSGY